MSEAVTVPSLMIMALIVSEELPAYTHTDSGSSILTFSKKKMKDFETQNNHQFLMYIDQKHKSTN